MIELGRPGPEPTTGAAGQAGAKAGKSETPSRAREEDAALVDRTRKGDQRAFRTLVEKYQRRVYTLALGFVRDPDEARDVAQEAFFKAYRHLGSFQGSASFYTWIYRITVNLCIDLKRKAGRGNAVEFDEKIATEAAGSPADDLSPRRLGFDPGRALESSELRKKITAALEELSEQHRAVLLLREVDGLSYKEIAEVMECPEGTVMSRLFHARQRMQELLHELADSPQKKEAVRSPVRAG